MELIYTTRRSGFEPGKHYRNPRFFVAPEHGATRVVIEGDYPTIASAYEGAGVSVKKPEAPKRTRRRKATEAQEPEHSDDKE